MSLVRKDNVTAVVTRILGGIIDGPVSGGTASVSIRLCRYTSVTFGQLQDLSEAFGTKLIDLDFGGGPLSEVTPDWFEPEIKINGITWAP